MELYQEVPNSILLMQVGAFMQVMNEDARVLNKITNLKLQSAGDVDNPIAIGGFPKIDSKERYIKEHILLQ